MQIADAKSDRLLAITTIHSFPTSYNARVTMHLAKKKRKLSNGVVQHSISEVQIP